jgi:hypothetical protein
VVIKELRKLQVCSLGRDAKIDAFGVFLRGDGTDDRIRARNLSASSERGK